MPESLRKLLPIRAKLLKNAWKRIEETFPELGIWLIDVENMQYQKTTWISWLAKDTQIDYINYLKKSMLGWVTPEFGEEP